MKTEEKWLATRTLRDETDSAVEVEVQLGFPEFRAEGEWWCAFRLKGLDPQKIEYGIGVDALQAIMTALEGIATFLRTSGRTLSWMGMPGETGIRRQIPMFMGADFANEIEAHIDAKIEAFSKTKQ